MLIITIHICFSYLFDVETGAFPMLRDLWMNRHRGVSKETKDKFYHLKNTVFWSPVLMPLRVISLTGQMTCGHLVKVFHVNAHSWWDTNESPGPYHEVLTRASC